MKKYVKKLSKKNIKKILTIIGIILISLYAYQWYNVKKQEKVMESYLIKTNTLTLSIKSLDEYNQIKHEMPNSYFLFIGYRNNYDEYKIEKSLEKVIDKYEVKDKFYYLDATDGYKCNCKIEDIINTDLNTNQIKKIPVILYYKDNSLNTVIDKDYAKTLNTLLQKENYEKIN